MLTRRKLLGKAVDDCMKEIYSYATPTISWEDFIKENKEYLVKEKEYYNISEENRPKYSEYMGPKPYEFYYIPKDILKDIFDSYVEAYKMNDQQSLLDTIQILKNYCKEPIVDKYIEGELREDGTKWPGHRGYDHPDNLEKEIYRIVYDIIHPLDRIGTHFNFEEIAKKSCDKFFEFLDMAGEFYNWNGELNVFSTEIYLGASPNSNKQAVIDNWKKYRNKDIEIDEEQIRINYYGEDYD